MPPPSAPAVQLLQVGEEWAGQRLDNFLLRTLKGAPKTLVYRIIRSGEVRVNKGRAKAETKLQEGDVLRIPPLRLADKTPSAKIPLNATKKEAAQASFSRKIPIIYEENGFLALDKAAGWAVHGGSGISLGVIEQLRALRQDSAGLPPYLELVHRLDRETSGVLLVAKKRSALVALQEQFKNRSTGKTYLALVKGDWPEKLKVLDQALRKYQVATGSSAEERRVEVVAADHPDAMRAVSLVKVLGRFKLSMPEGDAIPVSLLAVTIKTGRTHQIRVHLAHQGHGILGDDKYGDFALNKRLAKGGSQALLPRMFLHAWQLQVTQPKTGAEHGEVLQLHSPLPPELAQVLPASLQEALKNTPQKS